MHGAPQRGSRRALKPGAAGHLASFNRYPACYTVQCPGQHASDTHSPYFYTYLTPNFVKHSLTCENGKCAISSRSKFHHLEADIADCKSMGKRKRKMRAGTPTTIENSGTSFVTTLPAPTLAPLPIETPFLITALSQIYTSFPT